MNTYLSFRQLLVATLFMPFAVSLMASCARLKLLCDPWLADTRNCFDLLKRWAASLPKSSPEAEGLERFAESAVESKAAVEEPASVRLEPMEEDDMDSIKNDSRISQQLSATLQKGHTEALALSDSFFASVGPPMDTKEEKHDAGTIAHMEEKIGKKKRRQVENKPKRKDETKTKTETARGKSPTDEIDAIFSPSIYLKPPQ